MSEWVKDTIIFVFGVTLGCAVAMGLFVLINYT